MRVEVWKGFVTHMNGVALRLTAALRHEIVHRALQSNQLSGNIPASLGDLTNLQLLYVPVCKWLMCCVTGL